MEITEHAAAFQARLLARKLSAGLEHKRRMHRLSLELAAIDKAKQERLKKAPMKRAKKIAGFTLAGIALGIAAGWSMGAGSEYSDPLQAMRNYLHRVTAPAPAAPVAITAPATTDALSANANSVSASDPTQALDDEDQTADKPIRPTEKAATTQAPVRAVTPSRTQSAATVTAKPTAVKPPAIAVRPLPKPTALPSTQGNAMAELEEAARQAAGSVLPASPSRTPLAQLPQQGGVFVEIPSRGPSVPVAGPASMDSRATKQEAPAPKAPAYKVLRVMDDATLIQEGNSVRAVRKGDMLPDGKIAGEP